MADGRDKYSMGKGDTFLSSMGRDILRARESRITRKSVDEIKAEQHISSLQNEVRVLEQELISLRGPQSASNSMDEFNKKLADFTQGYKRIEEIRKEVNNLKRARIYVAEKQFQGGIQTAMSSRSTQEDIGRIAKSMSVIGEASNIAGQQTATEIEQRLAMNKRRIELQSQRTLAAATNINQDPATFYTRFNIREQLLKEQGSLTAGLELQRRQGLDTRSTFLESNKLSKRFEQEIGLEKIKDQVAGGKITSTSAKGDLDQIKREFIGAVKDFNDALRKGSANVGDFERKVVDLQGRYTQQNAVLDEVNKQGKSFKSFLGGVAQGIAVAGQAVVVGAQTARYGLITSEMHQTEQRSQFANIAADQYKDLFGMAQGDAASRRRVLSRLRETVTGDAKRMRGIETGVSTTEALGVGLQGAGGSVAGFLSGDMASAAGTAVQSLGQVAQQGIGIAKGIPQNEVFLNRYSQLIKLSNQMHQLDDRFMNRFTSLQLGLTDATRGLGVGRDSLMTTGMPRIETQSYISAKLPNADAEAEAAKIIDKPSDVQAYKELPFYPDAPPSVIRQMQKNYEKVQKKQIESQQELLSPFHGGSGQVTSSYGYRKDPFSGARTLHKGADLIPTSDDMRLQAMGTGTVYDVGSTSGGGNYVGVQYGENLRAKYRHMTQQSTLKVGQEVKGGEILGQVGNTGARSLGAHLHIETEKYNPDTRSWENIDPMSVIGRQISNKQASIPQLSIPVREGIGSREDAMQSIMSNLGGIGAAGISTEELPRIVGAARSALGKPFTRGAGQQVIEAGRMAQSGYFESPEQYFQARGALSNIGGNKENLADLLKAAVASGLDSSKNVMEMVQGISSMTDDLASGGAEVAGGAIRAISAMTQGASDMGLSENVATRAGLSTAAMMSAGMESGRLDIGGVVQTEGMRRYIADRGMDVPLNVRRSIARMNPAVLNELTAAASSGDASKQKQLEKEYGITPGTLDAEFYRKAQVESTKKEVLNRTGAFTAGKDVSKEWSAWSATADEYVKKGGKGVPALTEGIMSEVMATARMRGEKGLERGAYQRGPFGEVRGDSIPMFTGGLTGAGESQRQQGAEMGVKEVSAAMEQIKSTFGDVRAMVQGTSEILKHTDPKAWSEAAKEAAKEMAVVSTKGLDDVLGRFVSAFGPLVNRVEDVLGRQKGTGTNLNQNQNNNAGSQKGFK